MNAERDGQLTVVADVVRRFGLAALEPSLRACASLAGDAPLDVAVLGQFKAGKSSLLNAVLGESLFPVGALPVTAVITRAAAGPARAVRVAHLDETAEDADAGRLAEFVTEAGNPDNRKQVAVVDVFAPALRDWPGARLVDTPGLGSVFAHNTAATRAWLPNVAVALVTVSADRPLSDEDRRLVADWTAATDAAVADLRGQAAAWVDAELATLDGLLARRPAEAAAFREALARLDEPRP